MKTLTEKLAQLESEVLEDLETQGYSSCLILSQNRSSIEAREYHVFWASSLLPFASITNNNLDFYCYVGLQIRRC